MDTEREEETTGSVRDSADTEQDAAGSVLSADIIRRSAQLRAVIDAVLDLISVKNREGVYWLCNKAFSQYIGMSPREMVGRTDAEPFHEGEARRQSELDDVVLTSEQTLPVSPGRSPRMARECSSIHSRHPSTAYRATCSD